MLLSDTTLSMPPPTTRPSLLQLPTSPPLPTTPLSRPDTSLTTSLSPPPTPSPTPWLTTTARLPSTRRRTTTVPGLLLDPTPWLFPTAGPRLSPTTPTTT